MSPGRWNDAPLPLVWGFSVISSVSFRLPLIAEELPTPRKCHCMISSCDLTLFLVGCCTTSRFSSGVDTVRRSHSRITTSDDGVNWHKAIPHPIPRTCKTLCLAFGAMRDGPIADDSSSQAMMTSFKQTLVVSREACTSGANEAPTWTTIVTQ